MLLAIAIAVALASGPASDETLAAYAEDGTVYALHELGGAPFEAEATIGFSEGMAGGRAPCNSWRAELAVPYPWFELGPVAATRAVCPDFAEERRFFEALGAMTLAEVAGPVLILSDGAGREMVFRARPDPG